MEKGHPQALRCPNCLAANQLGRERCAACGAGLFPAGFLPAKRRRRAPAATDGPAERTAELQALDGVEAGGRPSGPDMRPDVAGAVESSADTGAGAADPPTAILQPSGANVGSVVTDPPITTAQEVALALLEPGWTPPRLYDDETEVLSSEAFRFFGETLVEEANQLQSALSLLVVELSREKAGGAEPNDVSRREIQALADVLRHSQHDGDLVARLEALRFALLLRGPTAEQTVHIAKWVKLVVGEWPLNGSGRVLLSQGIAELRPDEDLSTLVRRAQATVAWAIQGGGSRIRMYGVPEERVLAVRSPALEGRYSTVKPASAGRPARRSLKKRAGPAVRARRNVSPTVRVIEREAGGTCGGRFRVDVVIDGVRLDLGGGR